jgi:hypothetical protein
MLFQNSLYPNIKNKKVPFAVGADGEKEKKNV